MLNDRLSLSSQAVARHPDSSLCSKRRRFAEVAPGSLCLPGRPARHTPPHPTPLLSLGTKPCLSQPASSASLFLSKMFHLRFRWLGEYSPCPQKTTVLPPFPFLHGNQNPRSPKRIRLLSEWAAWHSVPLSEEAPRAPGRLL